MEYSCSRMYFRIYNKSTESVSNCMFAMFCGMILIYVLDIRLFLYNIYVVLFGLFGLCHRNWISRICDPTLCDNQ